MSVVALDITGENKDLIAKLLQLEKRADSLEAKLKGMGASSKRSGREAADGFQEMAVGVGKFALALAGVGSIEAVIGKIIAETRKGIQEMRRLQTEAAGRQMSMSAAIGSFLNNNQSLRVGDAAAPWIRFAETQAIKLPAIGAPQVLEQLGLARSALAGTPEDDMKEAFAEAVKLAVLNPKTDLSAATQALVRIRKDMGGTSVQAANFYSAFAEVAGADIAKTAKELPKLQGLSALGRGNILDTAALHALQTSIVPDATGEQTTTTVTNLLTRVATRDVDMGRGRKMTFRSEKSLDRLVEAAERINAGEFGDKAEAVQAFTSSLGREAASATMAITGLMSNLPQMSTTIAAVREGWQRQTSTTDEMLAAKERVVVASASFRRLREEMGRSQTAEHGDASGAGVATSEEILKEWGKTTGIGSAFDFSRPLRRAYGERYQPVTKYEEDEKLRRARLEVGRRLPGFSPGSSDEDISMAMRTRDELRSARTWSDVMAVGALGGAVDFTTRLDRFEQAALRAAGAPEERIQGLQTTFETGRKDDFRRELTALLEELRQNAAAGVRQPEGAAEVQPTASDRLIEALDRNTAAQQAAAEKASRAPGVRQELD